VCNADAFAPIRIAIANETSGKVVGVTDLNINLLNDQTEFNLIPSGKINFT
jgi:hypothetical protein